MLSRWLQPGQGGVLGRPAWGVARWEAHSLKLINDVLKVMRVVSLVAPALVGALLRRLWGSGGGGASGRGKVVCFELLLEHQASLLQLLA